MGCSTRDIFLKGRGFAGKSHLANLQPNIIFKLKYLQGTGASGAAWSRTRYCGGSCILELRPHPPQCHDIVFRVTAHAVWAPTAGLSAETAAHTPTEEFSLFNIYFFLMKIL